MTSPSEEGLKRVIGIRGLAASAVNLTVGAGIFALPAVVAGYIGSASILAYIMCSMLLMLILLCFIELGTKFSSSGGAYIFVEHAFGPYAGFLINSLYWFGYAVMSDAAIANVMADNLSHFFPILKNAGYRIIFFALVFGSVAWLNIRGVKQGLRLVEIFTLAKLIPLVALVVCGLFVLKPENLAISQWPSVGSLGEVSLVLFFAFGGAEATLSNGGEIKNPVRTIPIGLLVGVFIILIVHVSIHLVSQGVLGSSLTEFKEAPLAQVAEQVFGNYGSVLLVTGAAISCFGVVSGDILSTSRMLYAGSRDGISPSFLAKIHPRYATPYWSILVYSGIGFILSISGGFSQLAILSSTSLLLIYIGVILATIKLRNIKVDGSFTIPGGLLVPVLALVATGWFLSGLSRTEILAVILFLVFISLVYFGMRELKKRKQL